MANKQMNIEVVTSLANVVSEQLTGLANVNEHLANKLNMLSMQAQRLVMDLEEFTQKEGENTHTDHLS